MPNTERDLIEEVEELLAKATPGPWKTFMQSGPLVAATPGGQRIYSAGASVADKANHEDDVNLIVRARNELLRRLVERDKRNRDALKMMVELWDAEHPDDPCGCVGASDDCKCPPTCELCVARMLMEGRDPADA